MFHDFVQKTSVINKSSLKKLHYIVLLPDMKILAVENDFQSNNKMN